MIALQANVSPTFVNKLRHSINDNNNLTHDILRSNFIDDQDNLTENVFSGNQEKSKEATRTYVTKDGVEAKMRVRNIGQGKVGNTDSEELNSSRLASPTPKKQSKFLPPDVTAKGRGLKLFNIEIQRETLDALKEYIDMEGIVTAEGAILRLLEKELPR